MPISPRLQAAGTVIRSQSRALTLAATALASNPSQWLDNGYYCPAWGESYAGPSAGTTSYSLTQNGCYGGPYDTRLEAYFWDGGWWAAPIIHDNVFAYYPRTLYSAAVEGWHHTQFGFTPYQRNGHTYASP